MNVKESRIPVVWWGLLLRAVVGTALLLGANMVRSPLHSYFDGLFEGNERLQLYATGFVFLLTPVLVVVGVWLWMRYVERMPFLMTGLTDLRAMVPGLVGGTLIVGAAVAGGWAVLHLAGYGIDVPDAANGGDVAVAGIGAVVFYTLVRAFLLQGMPEELIYRGWFFALTKDRPMFTFWWTTFAFMIIHLTSMGGQESFVEHVYYLALPLGMGMLAGAVVLWRGSVWWAVGTHGGMHVWQPLAFAFFPADMGPVSWFAVGGAQIIVAVLILLVWRSGSRR